MNIKFYPLDIDYKDGIRVFGKTENNKRIVVLDNSLNPYFYAIPDNPKDAGKLKKQIDLLKEQDNFVVKTEIEDKKFLKDDVKAIKIYVNTQNAIQVISDLVKELGIKQRLETDVPFYKKYLIEKSITPLTLCEVNGDLENDPMLGLKIEGEIKQLSDDIIKPKILAIDIETYSFSPAEDKHSIIAVALAGENYKKVITWKKFENYPDYVEFVKNEGDLLIKLKDLITELKPDYLIGYNSDAFDLPYIMQRAHKYGIFLDLGVDGSPPKISRGIVNNVKIKGIVHLDLFQFIRKTMAGSLKLDSYSLDSVSKELLQEGKKKMNMWNMTSMWDKDEIKTICEYNLHDAVLTYRLTEKILPNLNELVKLIGMPLFEVSRMSYGQLVENFLMKKSKELNQIIPSRPISSSISERRDYTYQGAFVMEPKPGFYKNIVVFDFKSIYPSLIVAKNICPSTLGKKGNKSPDIEGEGNYYFDNKKEGFIPKVIDDLIERRNRVRELLKKENNTILEARSYALKTVANAMYGYMGFFGARWYCKECVSSITAWARDSIKLLNKACEKNNFNVIYNDTDSCCIELKEKTKEDALNFLSDFNKKLPKPMELGLENFYPYGIFVSKKSEEAKGAKKKYALIDENNKIKIIGFETVRRDWSKLARETQKIILKIILEENNPKKALEYVQTIIKKLRNKEIEAEDLIIQTQLKMNIEDYEQIGPHVAVARRMQEKGYPVSPGVPIWFIIIEGKGMIRDRARLPEEYKEKEYDTEYYINNQIIPAVEKILDVFGYKKEDLLKEKEQLKLGDF